MRKITSCVLLIILSFPLLANYGLFFKSKEYEKEQRTGLDLSLSGLISYTDSISLKFDISFRKLSFQYGTILSLSDRDGQNNLSLVCNFPELILINNNQETTVKISLSEEEQRLTNRWHTIRIQLNTQSNIASLAFDNLSISDTIEFASHSDLAVTYGVVHRYGFTNSEVPPISIKDIFLKTTEHNLYWPLNKVEGDIIKDLFEGKKSQVINPEWLITHHQQWKKIKTIQFDKLPQIAYDEVNEQVYFTTFDDVSRYDLNSELFFKRSNSAGYPLVELAQQSVINQEGQLMTYSFNRGLISSYDINNFSWSQPDSIDCGLPKFWHHNRFTNSINNRLTCIGGYGYYKYNSLIQEFDEGEQRWKPKLFNNNPITPRYLAALGKSSSNQGLYYLFGGTGNVTGNQIVGNKYLNDLYKIDFLNDTIIKLWGSESSENSLVNANSMLLDPKDQHFYTLRHSFNKTNTFLQLYKGDIHSSRLVAVGDSIPYYFVDTQSFSDLYYWNSTNQMVCLTMDMKSDGVYSVNLYSILNEPEVIIIDEELSKSSVYGLALLIFSIIGLIIIIVFIRKRRVPQKKHENSNIAVAEIQQIKTAIRKSSICCFGAFQVIDKNARDITYRFSPTLKELFILLLFHSIDGRTGISSSKIQEEIWPDKSPSSAKNNRGVNIKKLRNVLEDIGNVVIVYENNLWRIELDEEVYCDVSSVWKYFDHKIDQQVVISSSKVFLDIVGKGSLLPNFRNDWIDPYKELAHNRIIEILELLCHSLSLPEDAKMISEAIVVIDLFDNVNETALKLKCQLQIHNGQHSLAQETYKHFIKHYKNIYNDDYPISFNQLIKD